MDQQQRKRMAQLGQYAVQVARQEGLPDMLRRGAVFVRRRFFGR